MSPDDRRLAAVLAAFTPRRVGELAALVGGDSGVAVRVAAEALVGAGRSARLAELARALGDGQTADAGGRRIPEAPDLRLCRRLHLELYALG